MRHSKTFRKSRIARTWRSVPLHFLVATGIFLWCGATCLAEIPRTINHQGKIKVAGKSFNGNGLFYFAIVKADGTNRWTNDGSRIGAAARPNNPVTLQVQGGVYSVRLGDNTLPSMVKIEAPVFSQSDLRLRVWFDDGAHGVQQLSPDSVLTSAPYAYTALNAVTSHFSQFGGDGRDGATTISGTVNLGALRRQYTSLNIPSGSTLKADQGWAFIAVQGKCTIAGALSADGMGAPGGGGGHPGEGGEKCGDYGHEGTGNNDRPPWCRTGEQGFCVTGAGGGGGGDPLFSGGGGEAGAKGGWSPENGGDGYETPSFKLLMLTGAEASGLGETHTDNFSYLLFTRGAGGGGGTGSSGTAAGGNGGNGGGTIYIECNELVFTGSITSRGLGGGAGGEDAGNGGGGGGGLVLIRALKVTTKTGTVNVSGGIGLLAGNGAAGFWDIVEVK